ncbi:UDP-glycosyltransferase 89A2-like [Cornus florida]|uniref:UDP-glycosyltransferase 89A2-like n=1 Tax=Cornus florida TaxID=4283 RepID=UPI0028A1A2AF|nr:UDP-glycosyltransferase 89A2-like [Cornus florida]
MSNSGEGVHILVFPYPAQGHMLPMLDLTHQLALHGLTITILVTPKNLPILNPLLSTHASIQTLILPFPHHPSLPAGVENVRDVGNSGNVSIINALSKLHDPIIQWFQSHPKPPVAILSDFFLGWTHHLAHQLGIPRIAFFSSGAFLTSVCDYLYRNKHTVRSLPVVNFPDLPRSPSFTEEHLPSVFRLYRESDPEWEFVMNCIIANTSGWGCVFNSFDGLESEYLDHLKKKMGHGRVFGVGPLNLGVGAETMGRVNPSLESGDRVLTWLDECPDGSVLYVCFGSQKFLKKAQIEALASGLEWSGIRFVWVIKPPTAQQVADGYGSLPDGFEERVSGRGMVIKGWAPQVAILSHRAVGGFVSHCGWNSVLEGIVAGVMILGWPMEADQYVNARLLVEDLRAAVRVCEGADKVPDSAELARIISKSMGGSIIEKEKTKQLRDKAVEAVKGSGSSKRDLVELVRELVQLKVEKLVH